MQGKLRVSFVLVVLLIVTLPIDVSTGVVDQSGSVDWWTMFRHNLSHTGYSTSSAPSTANVQWNYMTAGQVRSSPAVADGIVFVGSYDDKVYALNATTGTLIWSYTTGGDVFSSPAFANGRVFVGSTDGKVYALNASTGVLLWNYTTGGAVYSSPAIYDGKVYVGSFDGKVYALSVTTGDVVWSFLTGGSIWSSPAIADGKVFIGSRDNRFYILSATTGGLIWSYETGGWVDSSPAVAAGRVFVGSNDEKFYAFTTSGGLLWGRGTGGMITSSPAVAGDLVYITSLDGYIYVFYAPNGGDVWRIAGGWASSIAVADGKIFNGVGSSVYCRNATTGSTIWSYSVGDYVDSSPAVADGKVFVGSYNGGVYCFGSRDVAILSVVPSINKAAQGQIVNITVAAKNEGTAIETFNVNTYYDSYTIGTLTVNNLAPSTQTTLTFSWNTTTVPLGTYRISAVASPVPGENDLSDNAYTDGTVQIVRSPVASFTYSPECPAPSSIVTFNATFSTPNGGTISSYEWNFGDGNTTSVANPIITHVYNSSGTYNVTLTIIDSEGLNDTAWKNVPVYIHDIGIVDWRIQEYVNVEGYWWAWAECKVHNQGTQAETFNVTLYYDNTPCPGTTRVLTLFPAESEWVHVEWDPTGITPGWYTMKFVAGPVPGETNITDNTVTSSSLFYIYDTAITDITSSTNKTYVGQTINITVTVTFKIAPVGPLDAWLELFLYCNNTQIGYYLNESFIPPEELNITLSCNTTNVEPGNYTLEAIATPLEDEINEPNTANNNLTNGIIQMLPAPDIAVTNVTPSKTVVGQGYSIPINVTIENQGNYTETFNVRVFANTTSIASQTVTLSSGSSATLTFTWDTSGFAKGNYTISAYALSLPGETDTADNSFFDGWVFITIPGDVNGDEKVNILDCMTLANHFGHRNGDGHTPCTKEWIACMNSDINCDLKVNILDAIRLACNFGQKWA